MRHRVSGRKLGRDTKHRTALFRNLARSLVLHGSVTTTEAKGKELKRVADRLVGKAKTDSVATRRTLHRFFGKRDVVNTLVDQVAPVFKDRISGFTTLKRSGTRSGDNTQLVTISWVENVAVASLKNPNPQDRPAKKAAKATKAETKAATKKSATASKPATKKTTTAKKETKKTATKSKKTAKK